MKISSVPLSYFLVNRYIDVTCIFFIFTEFEQHIISTMGIYTKYFFIQSFLFFEGSMLFGYLMELFLTNEVFEWSIIISSVIGAIILSLTFTFYYKNRYAGENIELYEDGDTIIEQKKITSNITPNKLLKRLKDHPKTRKMKAKQTDNEILVSLTTTFQTWGYNLKIDTSKVDENNYEYTIISRQITQPLSLLFGNNLKNIRNISAVFEG